MIAQDRVAQIKALVLDVDGVLTDGSVGYLPDGEVKFFDAKDAHALKLVRRTGVKVGLLSGRSSAANRRYAEELTLDFLYEGEKNKPDAFRRLTAQLGLSQGECLYVGDDVVDIPVCKAAGIGVAVADAVEELQTVADWTTERRGGCGAVREVAVWLLKAQGTWDSVMARYVD